MKPQRVLGHSAHPPCTHLPMGLWMAVPVWDALALLTGKPHWWMMSFWSIVGGLAFSAPALATGLLEYAALAPDHPAESVANRHMAAMLAAAGAFGLSALARAGMAPPAPGRLASAVALSALGAAALGLGGWLGGELIFRYKLGGEEAPK